MQLHIVLQLLVLKENVALVVVRRTVWSLKHLREETLDDSDCPPDEVPQMMANLSTVALDSMYQGNIKELDKDRQNIAM